MRCRVLESLLFFSLLLRMLLLFGRLFFFFVFLLLFTISIDFVTPLSLFINQIYVCFVFKFIHHTIYIFSNSIDLFPIAMCTNFFLFLNSMLLTYRLCIAINFACRSRAGNIYFKQIKRRKML